ncbi:MULTISPECIES: CBS domain-containing protein [unclassified Micromonospora]|uniref:CBS domain-containing protein n=1 Tax=unclassified Micromonospora TaxID=2617518 RepID=UPI001B3615F3|nr:MULTISPECIES: CBS domain-containing protein [unclassified Micromonospora]MBQ1043111.1 CBS domain-containing protein [Micromonospora sp. C72]MBQ1056758.1 CBS domain-containing protein [Micromonospora sp. C32]
MRTWHVADVMTRDVAAVTEQTPYREIVDVLVRKRISGVPVVDSFHRVLGVISEADLLHKVERAGHPDERRVFEGRRRRTAREKADALVAADLMTAPPVTTHERASLAATARLMDREAVKRVPVLDDLGRLSGIVTRGDLLRVHLRTDAEIREEVVHEVLRRVLSVRDGLVTVQVRGGEVTMDGRLDRRSAVDLAGRLAGQVAGVVAVHNTIGYDLDDTTLMELDPVHATPVA